MTQSFLTIDSIDKTVKCDHSLESCCAVLYCGAQCLLFNFSEITILENLLMLHLALLGVKGLTVESVQWKGAKQSICFVII